MKLRDRRVGLLVLTVMVFVSAAQAQVPLRPLVMRSNEQRGVAPAECAEGVDRTPVPPRITASEIPLPETEPAEALPPPSSALRGNLEAVQNALIRNDRPAFDENLARARTLVETYPRGGERNAAEEVMRVYDDVVRLWNAQYVSPFFGEGSAEYAAVSAYPGYAEAVRRATFTDARGNRFYPAAESRAFLANVATQRLQRLGIRTTTTPSTRVARAERPSPLPSVSPVSPRRSEPSLATPRRDTMPRDRATGRTTTRSSTRATPRTTRATPRTSAAATSTPRTPNPVAPPTTAAVPRPATTTTAAPSSPGAGDAPASDVPPADVDAPTSTTAATPTTTDVTSPTDTMTSTADVPSTGTAGTAGDTAYDTAGETAASATSTTPEAPASSAQKRPVFLASILILIGLGVLIVLFRASR